MNVTNGPIKWTWHRGPLTKVQLHLDEERRYVGYVDCNNRGDGVCWPATTHLPSDHYWDNEEKAIDGMVVNLTHKRDELNSILSYLMSQEGEIRSYLKTVEAELGKCERMAGGDR